MPKMQDTNIDGHRNAKKSIFRMAGLLIAVILLAFGLGAGYLLIASGLLNLALIAVVYWPPAARFITHFRRDQSPIVSPRPRVSTWRGILIAFRVVLFLAFIGFGARILFVNTFCAQNIICILIHHR
jgi:hypothetical protein